LGCPPQDIKIPPDLNAVSEDDEYIIIDLVVNWAADGLLLAFFHVIKDKDSVANNDPARRHEGWSNLCGAVSFGDEAVQTLQRNIAASVMPPKPTRVPPTRVFQLHTSLTTPAHPNSLLFTWPPPRPPNALTQMDGLYDADEYAEIMQGVEMDPEQLESKPGDVRTNCSTRFGAEHLIRTEGVYRHISSVFIPYGTLVFACFQTTKCYPLPLAATTNDPWQAAAAAAAAIAAAPPAVPSVAPTLPPPRATNVILAPPAGARDWRQSGEYEYPTSATAPHFPDAAGAAYHSHYPYEGAAGVPFGRLASNENTPTPPRATGGSTRPLVRPPGDVDKCRGCGTRESPEWRKGENGVKDLCNACGLKLARAVAKREGRQKPRKKDKV
jgi:hypothetical protein